MREEASFSLVVCTADRGVWRQSLKPGQRCTIGREKTSDIVLDYPWVSQRHAVIVNGNPPQLVDLGSRNGTSVDSRALTPGAAQPLTDGSVIGIAGISLLVQREATSGGGDGWRRPPSELTNVATVATRSLPPAFEARVRDATGAPPAIELVTCDPKMQELCAFVEQIAASDITVLVLGETGVGKELIARSIHEQSGRSKNPLTILNCAAIPENLVESELFGHERGAFSGAISAKPGLFEAASGSTLFLDEVGELPLSAQAKLLRVLEAGEVLRLGALRARQVDVRVVAATNRDLEAAIIAGRFRLDLFYRLNGVSVRIPPLRARPDDIGRLADHFADGLTSNLGPRFTPEAKQLLLDYSWPGNVRELKSTIVRAALLARGGTIRETHIELVPALRATPVEAFDAPASIELPVSTARTQEFPRVVLGDNGDEAEKQRIQEALDRMGGNQTDAAKLLGISRRTLIKRLDRYSMVRPRKRRPPERDESGEHLRIDLTPATPASPAQLNKPDSSRS